MSVEVLSGVEVHEYLREGMQVRLTWKSFVTRYEKRPMVNSNTLVTVQQTDAVERSEIRYFSSTEELKNFVQVNTCKKDDERFDEVWQRVIMERK